MKLKIDLKKVGNIYKKIWAILGAWLIIGMMIFIAYPWYLADRAYNESSYNSKIEVIEFRPGHRGSPHVKLNSGWYLLRIDEMKIVPYIQPSDSIVKEKGSDIIKVFRKDENGNLILKEFD